ncbi:MAG: beta-ketoacyl synthase N-terminal-like domain-containing protein [Planctomycetaceae bacterium]
MITGGSEAALTPMGLSGFARMNALSKRNDEPEKASRPFDIDRDGFVLAEGAGVVILEVNSNTPLPAVPRYTRNWWAMACLPMVRTSPAPDPEDARGAMQAALCDAGLEPTDIDYINTHGTSTCQNKAETVAIKNVFHEHAYKLAVSSTKSQLGHLPGASEGWNSSFRKAGHGEQVAPPTINLDNPDPACDLDYIPHEAAAHAAHAYHDEQLRLRGAQRQPGDSQFSA